MKRFSTSLLMLLAAIICFPLSSNAEEFVLTTTQSTIIQADGTSAQNADVVLYGQALHCSQSKISGGAFTNMLSAYEGSPVVITKFDASEILNGKSLKSATLSFDAKCTVSGKNSNVQIASIGTNWDATTATWNNTNTSEILNAVNLNGDGVNVKTSTVNLTQDVTEILNADEDKVIGFAIYTFTGRDQAISNFKLTIEAIDASASSDFTVKFVDGNGNELKASDTRSESIGAGIVLTDADKAAIYNEDHTVKYIYVSDDAADKTVAADGSTVITVTFREAATWNYTINAVDGEGTLLQTLKNGTNFEAEKFDVAYAAYINVDGTIYKSSKLSSDKKGYYFTLDLNEDNLTKDVVFTASDITGVVYFSEAENIDGLTLTNNSNTFIRSSNGASAYAAEGDVVFTTLPNGKYKIATVICDATKNAGSVWNFKAGDQNVFEFTAGSVNWAEGTSEEFELNAASTDIALVKNGGNNQGVDLIYIIKTGDAELVAPAETTVDFNAMDVLTSSQTSTDGDITENKVITVDDLTLTVTPSTSNTPNRFWGTNKGPQLRVYGGKMTFNVPEGKAITAITINQGKWNAANKINAEVAEESKWTGNSTNVVLNVAGNTQINNIVVTIENVNAETTTFVEDIAALKVLAEGTQAKLALNNANVTFVNNGDAYVEDATGAVVFKETGLELIKGTALNGYVYGQAGKAALTASAKTNAESFTAAAAEFAPEVVAVEALENDAAGVYTSRLVKVENATIEYQTLKQGEAEIAINDGFKVLPEGYEYPKAVESITGIIVSMSGYNFFYPVSADDIIAGEVVIPEAANIAEAKALAKMGTNTEIKLTLNGTKATVMSNMAMEAIIEDETGAIMVDYNIRKLIEAEGMALTGTLIANITKDRYGVYTMTASDNTANSQITQVAAEVTPTATTIADIKAATPGDIVAKYVSLENVDLRVEDGGWTKYYYLVDGDNEIELQDSYYTLPEDLSIFSKFESIRGVVAYDGYSGFVFAPYGEYKAVEKEFAKVENIATVLKNVAEGEYIELSLNDAQVTLYEQARWNTNIILEDETAGIQIQDMSGPSGNATIFTELGQTFNGSIVLQYVVQDGISTLVASSTSVSDKYTSEVKDVVAKDIAFAEAKSEINNMKLVKVSNIGTEVETIVDGEGENAYTYYIPYMTDGTTKLQLSDQFSKLTYGENNKPVLPEKCNITGYVMPFPLYNESWTEIIGVTDYFIPTLIEEVEEPEPVSDFRKWDFTAWSEETKANLAADAATVVPGEDGTYPAVTPWRTYEKVGGPTEAEPDHGGNAYWYGTAIAGAEELTANGVVIAETKGLLFNTMAAGAMAIAVNYPSTSLGTYEGPAYLWIGGKSNSFTIPNVKSGSKITLGIESHKNTDARGVTLTVNGAEIGRAVPTTYEVFDFTMEGELTDETFSDVVLTNTNGCHIYFITVDATGNDGINDVNAVVKTINNDVYTINGVKVRNAGESLDGLAKGLYIIGGKKVVVK